MTNGFCHRFSGGCVFPEMHHPSHVFDCSTCPTLDGLEVSVKAPCGIFDSCLGFKDPRLTSQSWSGAGSEKLDPRA